MCQNEKRVVYLDPLGNASEAEESLIYRRGHM